MKYWPIRFDNRGVSPVIAVILMVAITVVLSGVLWAMLQVSDVEPDTNLIGVSNIQEKSNYWEISIGKVGTKSLLLDQIEIQIETNSGYLEYILTEADSDPQPFAKGLSTVYPLTKNGPVTDLNTGNPVNNNTIFANYAGCYVSYLDVDMNNRVSSGDILNIYKDYNNDGTQDIFPNYNIKIVINNEVALKKGL